MLACAGRGRPLGGEEEGGVVGRRGRRRPSAIWSSGEVLDGDVAGWGAGVAEFGAFELGGGGPGGEDGGLREVLGDEVTARWWRTIMSR